MTDEVLKRKMFAPLPYDVPGSKPIQSVTSNLKSKKPAYPTLESHREGPANTAATQYIDRGMQGFNAVENSLTDSVETVTDPWTNLMGRGIGFFEENQYYWDLAKEELAKDGITDWDAIAEKSKEIRARVEKSGSRLHIKDGQPKKFTPEEHYTPPLQKEIEEKKDPKKKKANPLADTGGILSLMAKMGKYDPEGYEKHYKELKRDYDAWDQIRDLSAGLLASQSPTFLQALGEASTTSNKRRDEIADGNFALKAKLRVKDIETQNEALKSKYTEAMKAKLAILKEKGKPTQLGEAITKTITNDDGVATTVTVRPWIGGRHPQDGYPEKDVEVFDSGRVEVTTRVIDDSKQKERRHNSKITLLKDIRTRTGTVEDMDSLIGYALRTSDRGGEALLSIAEVDDDWKAKLMKASNGLLENFVEAVEDEDMEDALNALQSMNLTGPAAKQLNRLLLKGLATKLGPDEYAKIRSDAGKLSLQRAEEQFDAKPGEAYASTPFILNSLGELFTRYNLGADNINDMFNQNNTLGELKQSQEQISGLQGSEGSGLMDWDIFNQSELPASHSLHGKIDKPWGLPDDWSISDNQLELLGGRKAKQWYNLAADNADVKEIIRKHGGDATQIRDDFMNSVYESKLIHGGRNNKFSKDDPAKYTRPEQWYVEPAFRMVGGKKYTPAQLREAGVIWNGFTGEHIQYIPDANSKTGHVRKASQFDASKLKKVGLNWLY